MEFKTKEELEAMTTAELAEEFNSIRAIHYPEEKAIKKFSDKKTGVSRIWNMLGVLKIDQQPGDVKKTKADPNKFRPAVEGMRLKYKMLTANPDTTRKEFITACEKIGLKTSTAAAQWRATMDKLTKRFGPGGKDHKG